MWAGRLAADSEELGAVPLDIGMALASRDSRRYPELRRRDCSGNDPLRERPKQAGTIDTATPD